MSQEWKPFSESEPAPRVDGLQPTARMTELLDIADGARRLRRLPKRDFVCNITQAVQRRPWGAGMRCLSSTSDSYDFGRDRW